MFLTFKSNANFWICFLGLLYLTSLLGCGAARRDSRRGPTRVETLRPAEKACNELEKNLSPRLIPHILGVSAIPISYPFMANLGYTQNDRGPYDFICSGTLIHDRFVLTAAHCVNRMHPDIVRLGMSDLDDGKNQIDAQIEKIYIHPEYSQRSRTNDVALIELERPVARSDYITPTCLYTSADLPEGSRFEALGYGMKDHRSSESNVLLRKVMLIESNSNCTLPPSLAIELTHEHFCASNNEKDSQTLCGGNSGGPLVIVKDESMRSYQQVGIMSFAFDCSSPVPGVFTKVSAHLDYIESIVWPLF